MEPGTKVEAKSWPFRGLRGTVQHTFKTRWLRRTRMVVELDQYVAGRNVLVWKPRQFEKVSPGNIEDSREFTPRPVI